MPALHLVVGPWASGKTSLVEQLMPLLPHVAVFDWDLLIPGLSAASGKDVRTDPSTWEGLRQTWKAILGACLAAQRDVVLCSPLRPEELAMEKSEAVTIRCAFLDCSDDVLSSRLATRGATEEEIADELATSRALRESGFRRFQVDNREIRDVAIEVSKWVTSTLA